MFGSSRLRLKESFPPQRQIKQQPVLFWLGHLLAFQQKEKKIITEQSEGCQDGMEDAAATVATAIGSTDTGLSTHANRRQQTARSALTLTQSSIHLPLILFDFSLRVKSRS